MSFEKVKTGKDVPNDVNVIIEIPLDSEPVKYEVDKKSGAIFVDRMLTTAMRYPCNYGYVPHTLCGDGDPLDAMVVMPVRLIPGSVINCRPIGVLLMKDEAGTDEKLLVVPGNKVTPLYKDVETIRQMPPPVLDQIAHFFEHYKDLEKGTWVKIEGWDGPKDAKRLIVESIARFSSAKSTPNF